MGAGGRPPGIALLGSTPPEKLPIRGAAGHFVRIDLLSPVQSRALFPVSIQIRELFSRKGEIGISYILNP